MGAPLSVDVSANFLMNEKLTLGVNYRWDESISALVRFANNPTTKYGIWI